MNGAQARPTLPACRAVCTSIDGERVGASSSVTWARERRVTRDRDRRFLFLGNNARGLEMHADASGSEWERKETKKGGMGG